MFQGKGELQTWWLEGKVDSEVMACASENDLLHQDQMFNIISPGLVTVSD